MRVSGLIHLASLGMEKSVQSILAANILREKWSSERWSNVPKVAQLATRLQSSGFILSVRLSLMLISSTYGMHLSVVELHVKTGLWYLGAVSMGASAQNTSSETAEATGGSWLPCPALPLTQDWVYEGMGAGVFARLWVPFHFSLFPAWIPAPFCTGSRGGDKI